MKQQIKKIGFKRISLIEMVNFSFIVIILKVMSLEINSQFFAVKHLYIKIIFKYIWKNLSIQLDFCKIFCKLF